MLIPALLVAHGAVRMRDGHGADYDVLLFTAPSHIDDVHRRWANENGIRLDCSLDISSIEDCPIISPYFSVAALYRLLLPGHLSGQFDRLLYLDADVRVCEPITALLSLDLRGHSIAASPTPQLPTLVNLNGGAERYQAAFRALGMTPPFRYFNSGVMVIDVESWLYQSLGSKALSFLRSNLAICPFIDESALNAVLDGDFAALSPLWNHRGWASHVPEIKKQIQPVIMHYDGPIKPWQKFGKARRLFHYRDQYHLYREVLDATPWQNWLSEQWGLYDLARNIEFELSVFLKNQIGMRSWRQYKKSERTAISEEFAKFCASQSFMDVEQAWVVYENGVLSLA